ncbi:hypothetical protein [Pseudomonas sp. UBA2684]|uniref:hypothetical protein n=1 Tax=Pseudomonas sp. UBA2684 TaxID=1947311 RepID=UPI0025DF38C6|nr:hypothetical protein [Pseudomonas sp. UBA2684]
MLREFLGYGESVTGGDLIRLRSTLLTAVKAQRLHGKIDACRNIRDIAAQPENA